MVLTDVWLSPDEPFRQDLLNRLQAAERRKLVFCLWNTKRYSGKPYSMNGLIIEGVAGTGKSTIASALNDNNTFRRLKPSNEIIYEERTTGELVTELRDERLSDQDRYAKLNQLIPEIH